MIIRLSQATLLAALVLLSGLPPGGEVPAAESVRVQDLVMGGGGDGLFRITVRSSGPLPASRCKIGEGADAARLVLELPKADSGLKPSYDFPGMPVGTIRVSPLDGPGGGGVRIATLADAAAELDAAPETRSARYARLGDGLLKVGQLDEAVEAFKTAIHYTQFDRKRTNFLVKMAVVMANKGSIAEADQLLDAALKLDPEDVSGAQRVMAELHKAPETKTCPA